MAEARESAESAATTAGRRARLEGAQLAARSIAHVINNDLTGALGNLSIVLMTHPDLPLEARQRLEQSAAYLRDANTHLQQFQRITRVVLADTPGGPILDLDASLQSDQA